MRRFKSMQALILATAALDSATPALAQSPVSQSPEARLAAYRDRVERLEAQDAVENLQADYGYYFDKGLWDDVADLFSKDGSAASISGASVSAARCCCSARMASRLPISTTTCSCKASWWYRRMETAPRAAGRAW